MLPESPRESCQNHWGNHAETLILGNAGVAYIQTYPNQRLIWDNVFPLAHIRDRMNYCFVCELNCFELAVIGLNPA